MRPIIVTGTDTGIGKTVFAAGLAAALGAAYWKPIQSGLDGEFSDSEIVRRLGGSAIVPEVYRLNEPLSPHRAAELEGLTIDPARLIVPAVPGPLVIEGAGGLLVPVTRSILFADIFARWQAPAVLVARTSLGTINHSLLSVEAMRARAIPILGIAFVGDANEDNEATICTLAGVKRLGRLPIINPLNEDTLAQAFATHFRTEDFV